MNFPLPSALSAQVKVQTPTASYPVWIGQGLLHQVGQALRQLGCKGRLVILSDETVSTYYEAPLLESLRREKFEVEVTRIPSGETSKALPRVADLLSFCAQHRLDRHSTLLALGGGVLGDLAGFVASIYLRGISFIQIPTTLLAMVDSSVGGKTGVNLPEGKNLVGAFHQPRLVLADLETLSTLPEREFSAGMAEVIKYGIIADPTLFNSVESGPPEDLAVMIQRCVEIKASIVAADEKETTGQRALLNFGHTLGHAFENALGYQTLLHGEAVALGMRAAAFLSSQRAGLDPLSQRRIENAIRANHLPLTLSHLPKEAIYQAMHRDKKAIEGKLHWVLTSEIGKAHLDANIPSTTIEQALQLLHSRENHD